MDYNILYLPDCLFWFIYCDFIIYLSNLNLIKQEGAPLMA